MKEFERSETINASSDRVFDFLSDVNNLPQYLPTVRNARQESADRIRVQGEAAGKQYDSTGYFRADRQNQRMEWGSDGESGYRGWLQVSEVDDDSCEVTVHLAFYEKLGRITEVLERHSAAPVMTFGDARLVGDEMARAAKARPESKKR